MFVIRLARAEDAQALARVKRRAWESSYRGIYPDEKLDNYDYDRQAAGFAERAAKPNAQLFVAEYDCVPVGYMCLEKIERSALGLNHEISLLYLLKEYQGRGFGREMFETGRKELARLGAESFVIACNKYNLPAQGFYKAMGGTLIKVDEDALDRSVPQKYFRFNINNQGGAI